MNIDIICPLYQGEKYILNLHNSLLKQKNVNINLIKYILTESTDNSETILNENKLIYKKIKKEEFSHSLVRENAIRESKADIICLISQDIVIEDDYWLSKLINPLLENKADASYSRQISKFNNVEKYTRESNYPDESCIKSKESINELGLKTFFFSDAASAFKREVFIELNGYDNKNLPINEDMYFAYKLIMNDYKIAYQADSIVYHSHKFKLKELYNRYKLTGKFMKENSYLNQYGTTSSGMKLAKYVLKRIIQEHRFLLLFRFPFDMMARWLGMKAGERN